MSYTKNESQISPSVIFDIGSASVGAAIVLVTGPNQIQEIIYDTRVPIVSRGTRDYAHLLSSMLSALKNVTVNVEQDGVRKLLDYGLNMKHIKNIFCVFSSSWHVSNIEVLKFKKEERFTVSEQSILNFLKDANKQFLESSGEQLREKNITKPNFIEKNIIQILLNGYNVNKPYGKKVNSVDITLFMSIISSELFIEIKNNLKKVFNTDNISFHTFALSSFSVVRDIFNSEKNFLLMDISGEATNIILVRNETMIKNKSFSLGKNFLIKKVADNLGTVNEEAHSLIRLFLERKSTGAEMIKMKAVLDGAREKWLSHIREILLDFSDGLFLPKTIFLTIDTDIGRWFIDTIKSDEFSMYTLAEQPFNVVELSSRILGEYCLSSQEKTIGCDPFLAIEAIFVNKIANK